MASSLINALRTARDQHGIAPDANNGALLVVAGAGSSDPEQIVAALRARGVTLDPASVLGLAAVVASHTGGDRRPPAEPATASPPPPRDAQRPAPGRATDPVMSFLSRVDDRPAAAPTVEPAAPPASSVVPGAPSVEAPAPSAEPGGRRRQRRGLSAAHDALLAARGPVAVTPPAAEPVVPPGADESQATGPVATPPEADETRQPPATVPSVTESPAPESPAPEPPAAPAPDLQDYSDDVDVFAARDNAVHAGPASDGIVELSWQAADAEGDPLVYLLVSSATGVPVRPGAGSRLLTTTSPRAEVPVGSGPYFTVFSYSAAREEALPSASPVLHAAGRIAPEVTGLRVNPHADAVVLSWVAPVGVARVRVMRSLPDEHLPPHFDASREIPSKPEFAKDSDTLPGRRYEYRVLTEFVDANTGHRTLSTGIEAVAVIPATPDPVTGLSAEVSGETSLARIELRWRTPALGRVVIYESATVPEHAASGRVISLGQLEALPLGLPVGHPTLFDGATSVVPGIPFRQADGPRRAFTPVTLIGEQAAVGPAAVVNLLGAVTDATITERVDWQLLRFAWPVGANFVEVERGAVGADPDGTAAVRISREEYRRAGGLRLSLPLSGCDLHIRGSVSFGGEWTRGPVSTVTYPGRWVLRYQFEKVGMLGRRRKLQLRVDRPWPDFQVVLTHHTDRMPLTYLDFSEQPQPLPIQGAALTPGEWVTVHELPNDDRGFLRLFASHPDAAPIVVDPPLPARPVDVVAEPLAPGELRCVTCMQRQPAQPRMFRCEGSCPVGVDRVLSGFLGEEVRDRPIFPGPPLDAVACPACSATSRQAVCAVCHSVLPVRSAETDPVSVTVVGARGTGKTTFLVSLCDWIEKVWGPASGAPATPLDEHTTGRLRQMRELLDQGTVVGSTTSLADGNRELLAPLLMGLDARQGRLRALALYDVSGEDVEDPGRVAPYGPTLARADALLFLLDPLQIPDVRIFLEGQIPLPAAAGDPVKVLHNVIGEIRRRRGAHGRIGMPIMVAVSKLDGIHQAVLTPGTNLSGLLNGGSALMYDRTPAETMELAPSDQRQVHEETRSLLQRLGAAQFLSLVEDSFSRVDYFGLSALGHAPAGNTTLSQVGVSSFRVADPARWLVARRWPAR